ncbi:MAG: S-layer homology domain-containing protein [bacterium]|nr:S-layer homology domain-containing protein [Acidimicrobiia bacterium]MCY4650854.1 S-layer homology domain-containing protein [bacterium]
MLLTKRIALTLLAFLLMAAAWDECAQIPGENQYDDKTLSAFSDVTKTHRLYNGIRIAEIEGWFVGYQDGTLRPDEVITAEQIATVVKRLYPDGATRAEVANFLAAGSVGVIQKNVILEVSQADQTVTVSNLGSFPINLDGYELSWTDENDSSREHVIENLELAPGTSETIHFDDPLPTSITLNNRYSLQIAAS